MAGNKLKLFNTLTKKKEIFKPIDKNEIKMYTCGPTVYDYPHIGNYRAYIASDILKRALQANYYKVKHIMNITDVDDKTIKSSRKEGVSLKEFTEKYTKIFFEELRLLNILPAEIYTKATDNIKEMVDMIKGLINKKIAYRSEEGSIYYSISKFRGYGKLAHLKFGGLKAGARVKQDEYSKDAASDFALWKAWDNDDGNVFWETELGKGRPGWHIECSAMSTKHLGKRLDIHTGGIDLVFPHHQNEIAQVEPITKKKFVNYWVHNEWLFVDGRKMSKSLGNFYTLRDLIDKEYNPLYFRYLCLLTHYRKPLNFTFDNLDSAKSSYERLRRKIIDIRKQHHIGRDLTKTYLSEFYKVINNDLNSPKGLQIFFKALDDFNFDSDKKLQFLEKADYILGIGVNEMKESFFEIPKEVEKLMKEREKLRVEKKWAEADILRQRIKDKGYEIEDNSEGPIIRKEKQL